MSKFIHKALIIVLFLQTAVAMAYPSGFQESLEIQDVHGERHRLAIAQKSAKPLAQIFVFLGTECVISRRAIADLNELARLAEQHGQRLYGVLADDWETVESAKEFADDYQVDFPLLMDHEQKIAHLLQPRVRPEAFVLDADLQVKYRGRINNEFSEISIRRNTVTKYELRDAMVALGEGREPEINETQAIGCVYKPWKREKK